MRWSAFSCIPARGDAELPTIGDVTGRQVILRGVNVNQLIDYHLRDPAVPAVQPPTDDDFAQMASMGFNVVRLGMSWSRLEPRAGRVRRGVPRRRSAPRWPRPRRTASTPCSTCTRTPGATRLARPTSSAAAAPRRRPAGTAHRRGRRSPTARCTASSWRGTSHPRSRRRSATSTPTATGSRRELVRTWAFVAAAFADEPAVAGYDLLNEPGIGANPPISSGLLLGRYYDAAITAIRDAETTGRWLPPPGLLRAERAVVRAGVRRDPAAGLHRRPAARVRAAPVQRVDHDGPELRADDRVDRAEPHRVGAGRGVLRRRAVGRGVGLVRRPDRGRRQGATLRGRPEPARHRRRVLGVAAGVRLPGDGRRRHDLREPRLRRLRYRARCSDRHRASPNHCRARTRGPSPAGSTRSSPARTVRSSRSGRRSVPATGTAASTSGSPATHRRS